MASAHLTDSPLARHLEKPAFRAVSIALAAVFILFARRYEQWLDPEIWQEEGVIVSQAVTHGLASLLMPLSGYLLTASRLVSLIALLVPLHEYPRVATLLTWAFTAGVLCAIAVIPSGLRGGAFLAVAALFVPTDAEVYGIPLYTFWWTVPLLYACYFWPSGPPYMWWRAGVIILAGLSVPTIALVAPLFVLKAIVRRTGDDLIAAAAAAACSLVQLTLIVRSQNGIVHLTLGMIVPAVRKLFGGYLVWNLVTAGALRETIALGAGIFTLAFVALTMWREPRLRAVLGVVVYLWLGSAVLSIARVNVNIIDQAVAGPRYFFLPFVVEGWLLLQIVCGARNSAIRSIAAAMLLCAAFNTLPVLSRRHQDLAWKSAVAACAASPAAATYEIPIQTDGLAKDHWVLPLTGHQCHRLERFGLLGLTLP